MSTVAPKPNRTVSSEDRGSSNRPTSAQYWVVVCAVSLAVIAYVDRVCIAQAAPTIGHDLGLTDVQIGYAFAAFAWAYGLFEIPCGWLGDWIGPRKVLTSVVLVWSFFTAATGWVWNLFSLVLARFAFGAGQAGCFPNLTKVFSTWLPHKERTRAQGVMWMSARWGGAFTPLLVVWVLSIVSWRAAFGVFGVLGVVWAILFFRWYQDSPREQRSVNGSEMILLNAAEKNAVGHIDVPWAKILGHRTVRLLWLQYFCLTYGWFFYITWLPKYLQEARQLTTTQSAVFAGLPLFFGGVGCLFCGLISSRLAEILGSTARMRRWLACIGFGGAGALLLLSVQIKNPTAAMIAMGLASFANDLTMPGSWSTCMDVGGRYVGTLSGGMNMMASFAGGIAPIVTGYLLEHFDRNWALSFWLSALVYFAGGLCWFFIDPVTPIEAAN